MKRTSVGAGVYQDERGAFWARPTIYKRRTWRKLKAVKLKAAILEANTSEIESKTGAMAYLIEEYLKAGAPNKRLEPRSKEFVKGEKQHLDRVKKFFGGWQASEIKIPSLHLYKNWRVRSVKEGFTGERMVDRELNSLSNVLNYAVSLGYCDVNLIRNGRPRFQDSEAVQGSRHCAPESGDELNEIVKEFFAVPSSEVIGWEILFAAMTGCRTSELLRLRMDSRSPNEPGFIQGNHLFLGRRSKSGVNPWVEIKGDFKEMLERFLAWHKERHPKTPWFFPGREKNQLSAGATAHAMRRIRGENGPRRTPHGLRSFYVTKRRSDGASDEQIAAEIGDKTVALIPLTYGSPPPNWTGGKELSFRPKEGNAVWMDSFWTKSDFDKNESSSQTIEN